MKSFALLLCLAASVCAQQTSLSGPAPVYGQVSGRVSCQDTGLPGRFAGVQLMAEQPSTAPLLDPSTLGKNPDFGKIMAEAIKIAMKGSNLSTVTGIDGSFSLDKVPPGTYYVIPQLPGYRSPVSGFSQQERMKADPATLSAVESLAQKVVVQPGALTSITVEMERGATLSGTVTYDDGSPAPGVTPTLLVRGKDGQWKELGGTLPLPSSTDDRGHFRFYGLPPGQYAVKAALPVSQALIGMGPRSISMHMDLGDALIVYSSGALREKDIKPIELGDGEQRDGIEVIFPIHGLHSISGSVVAKSDNHPVNAGTLELQDSDSKTAIRTAMIGADGAFHMDYVPEGSYLLKVISAGDTELRSGADAEGGGFARMLNSRELRSYGSAGMPLSLSGDVTGLVLQVPDAPGNAASE
ncbi:MAG: carboxypeptidase-like regulatory domain-containing protein [Acidobacteriaceae bacterium]